LVANLPDVMEKRPKYLRGIGVYRGSRQTTAWLKIGLPNGGTLRGKSYPPDSVKVKVGNLAWWSWERLIDKRRELQGRADRGEPLEDTPDVAFGQLAEEWFTRAENRARAISTERIAVRKHLTPCFGKARASAAIHARSEPMVLWPGSGSLRSRNWLACSRSRKRKPDGSLLSSCGRFTQGCARATFERWYGPNIRELGPDRLIVQIRNSESGQPRTITSTRTIRDIIERQKGRRSTDDDVSNLVQLEKDDTIDATGCRIGSHSTQ